MYYNPMQARADSLMQQRQMIDSQLQQLQQFSNVPPININNQITPQPQSNFDFNGKWVSDESEAKGISNNNLPLILFDKNSPIFYIKNLDGSFKKFKFMEVVETQEEDRITALENKFNAFLEQFSQVNTPKQESVEKAKKGANKNE